MFITDIMINTIAEINGTNEISMISNFVPIILMFILLYFIMIRPQMKRQKEHKNLISSIVENDEIITIGGIIGKVKRITDQYVIIEISNNLGNSTELIIQKHAIASMLPKDTIKHI